MVLQENYMDFLMTVYGLTANLTWTYDVVGFNCHNMINIINDSLVRRSD